MEVMEIVLLIAGGVIFILSFLIPEKKVAAGTITGDEIQALVNRELDSVKGHVGDVVEEGITYAMEKTERSLERLSNEKIMAVSEYSDTVLAEIRKNHEETMFLYDMLNSKHTSLKNTVAEVNRVVKEAEEAITTLQNLVSEMTALSSASSEIVLPSAESAVVFPKEEVDLESMQEEQPEEIATEDSGDRNKQVYNNNENILRLYKEGMSAVTIARKLDLGVGEVKLVIDLFQNQ